MMRRVRRVACLQLCSSSRLPAAACRLRSTAPTGATSVPTVLYLHDVHLNETSFLSDGVRLPHRLNVGILMTQFQNTCFSVKNTKEKIPVENKTSSGPNKQCTQRRPVQGSVSETERFHTRQTAASLRKKRNRLAAERVEQLIWRTESVSCRRTEQHSAAACLLPFSFHEPV